MPRRPTRSQSDTPTRKELSRRLDDLTEDDYGDLDEISLAEIIGYETEVIDRDAGAIQIIETGELRKQVDVDEEIMAGLKAVHGEE